jgi:hypothetical protein
MASTAEFTVFMVPAQNWSPFLMGSLTAQIAKKLDKLKKNQTVASIVAGSPYTYVLEYGKQKIKYTVTVTPTGWAPQLAGIPPKWSLTLNSWS